MEGYSMNNSLSLYDVIFLIFWFIKSNMPWNLNRQDYCSQGEQEWSYDERIYNLFSSNMHHYPDLILLSHYSQETEQISDSFWFMIAHSLMLMKVWAGFPQTIVVVNELAGWRISQMLMTWCILLKWRNTRMANILVQNASLVLAGLTHGLMPALWAGMNSMSTRGQIRNQNVQERALIFRNNKIVSASF